MVLCNGKDNSSYKTFWETVISVDLFAACTKIESRLKDINSRLSGKVNHNAQGVYTSSHSVQLELFTHRHLPLYQQLNDQLSCLGEIITSLKLANAPVHALLMLEKEYQALELFLEKKAFLEIYQTVQQDYEAHRVEMVQWYNKLAVDYANEHNDYIGRIKTLATLTKQADAQRQSLITILFQTKEEYECYLLSRYTKETDINRKWQAYFGDLVWVKSADEIFELNNKPLSIDKLWQKIEAIFVLSKRPFYNIDSPIKHFLTKYLLRFQSDCGVIFNPQLKRFELIQNYQQQMDLLAKTHCSIIARLQQNSALKDIHNRLEGFRQKTSALINSTARDEQHLVNLIRKRVDEVIQICGAHCSQPLCTIKPPILMVNSVLRHLFLHYNEIVGYFNGISTSVDFWSKRPNRHKVAMVHKGKSATIPLAVMKLYQLVTVHEKKIATIESNSQIPPPLYSIHLEKIAFFEALFKLEKQYVTLSSNGVSPRFFSEDALSQQFFESCINLTSSNLFMIDESIEKLQKLYRLIHQTNNETSIAFKNVLA